MRLPILIAALLAIAVSGCSRQTEPLAASHPPAEDLRCLDEPRALTDAEVLADVDGAADREFNDAVLIAGRSCRDALGRVCRWHVERGLKGVYCDPLP